MSVTTMIETATQELKQHLRACCETLETDRLTPELVEQVCQGLTHAISAAALAGLRAFVEGSDVHAPTRWVNGTRLRKKQASAKTCLTPFGSMTLERTLYQADGGGPASVPWDGMWGMEGEFAPVEVREAVLLACAHSTPEETAHLVRTSALVQPSATAVKQRVEKTGDCIATPGETLDAAIRAEEVPPANTHGLVASLDGTHVLVDEPGPKQGRPPERPGQPPPDESATTYNQTRVGSLSFYSAPCQGKPAPERLRSHSVAGMPEAGAPTVKRRFEAELAEAEANLPPGVPQVLLVDGQRALGTEVAQTPRFDASHKGLDFSHTTEHLANTAALLFGKGSPHAQRWDATSRHTLLVNDGAAGQVVRSLDDYRTHRRLSKSRRDALKTERTFFRRNQQRMVYAACRRSGFPIGSGPVEAACKTLVKTRLGRSGMRWSRQGGQRLLQLRTSVKSGRWESFWKHYKHLRYANAA